MSVRVDFTIFDTSDGIYSDLSSATSKLQSEGWTVDAYSADFDQAGVLPHHVPAYITVDKVGLTDSDADKAAAQQAVEDSVGAGWLSAYSNFASSFVDQVVKPTVVTVANDVNKVVTGLSNLPNAVDQGAKGVGMGLGLFVGAAALVAGAYLVWRVT